MSTKERKVMGYKYAQNMLTKYKFSSENSFC